MSLFGQMKFNAVLLGRHDGLPLPQSIYWLFAQLGQPFRLLILPHDMLFLIQSRLTQIQILKCPIPQSNPFHLLVGSGQVNVGW